MKLITKIKNWLYPVPKSAAEPDPKKFFSKVEISGWSQEIKPEHWDKVKRKVLHYHPLFFLGFSPYESEEETWERTPAKSIGECKRYSNPPIDMTKSA